jgi:hypothetical protein
MLFKPPKLHFKAFNLLLLGLLLCIFTAGAALADPPADKPCKGSKCPPPVPQMDDNYVWWGNDSGEMFYEFGSRTCELALMAPDDLSGTYDCPLMAPYITYDTSDDALVWEQLFKRGEQYWCDRPDVFRWAYPDLQYSYSWTGDCTVGCDITIVNRISADQTGFDLGNVTFEAVIEGVVTPGNPVPFTVELHRNVNYLLVTKFAPKGKDKILAICKTFPAPGTLTFHISPAGTTTE